MSISDDFKNRATESDKASMNDNHSRRSEQQPGKSAARTYGKPAASSSIIIGKKIEQPTYTKDELRQEKLNLLTAIIKPNYDKELNTYDFDGIAEKVFKERNKLLEEL